MKQTSKIPAAAMLLIIFLAAGSAMADSTMHQAADTIHKAAETPVQAYHGPWDFPNLHPLVVHFPIVLLLTAAFFQLLSFFRRGLNFTVLLLLIGGTAGAWLAAEIFDAHPVKNLPAAAKEIFHLHHRYADYTTWLSSVALALKLLTFFIKQQRLTLQVIVFVVMAAAAGTVCISGHYGSYLVHIEGVGPKGNLLRP